MSTSKRRVWFAVAVILVGVSAAGYLIPQAQNTSPIVECKVTLGVGAHDRAIVLLFTDKAKLGSLLDAPLRAALKDPAPQRYEGAASLEFIRDDGSKRAFVVFAGWSKFSEGEGYFIADLAPLRDHIRKVLTDWAEQLH